MNKTATALFLAKMIHEGKITYSAVIMKYPELKDLIDEIGKANNLHFNADQNE